MSFVRRSLAALSGLFLLQLLLLGSGTLCAMQRQSSSGHVMQMAGMARETGSHESSVASADEADGSLSPAETGDHDGCRVPLAPGQCTSMSACSISATLSESEAASLPVKAVALAAPTPARVYSGPTFAPELPPPRV